VAAIVENPRFAAKFHSYAKDQRSFIVPCNPASDVPRDVRGVPVPPDHFLWGYTRESFLLWGERDVQTMRKISEASGFTLEGAKRILDFGCGPGRMIRWLTSLTDKGREIWGADMFAESIVWCQQHLSPPFWFTTTTSLPHLPFEDGYFDFLYAGSVFTHIADLADAWLLELRRVVRPGGRLYLTIL
jgi:ubiquinone/menaquinone biosynthesis C-methylase UbiE